MMSWVITQYAPPFSSCTSMISSQRSAVRTGSSPESGSSNSTMSGSSTSAREAGALAHSARELVRHLLRGGREADLAEPPRDDLADLVLALVRVLAEGERGVVVDVHRAEERAVLEQDAELLAHLEQVLVGHLGHGLAVDDHVALVRVEQADHVLDADRLPGPRRAQDHRDLVVGQAEVETVQHAVAAEGLDDVDELHGVVRAVLALRARVPLVLVGLGLRAALVRHLAGGLRRLTVLLLLLLLLLLAASLLPVPRLQRTRVRLVAGLALLRLLLFPALLAHFTLTRLSVLVDSSPRRSVSPPFPRDGPSRCSTPSISPSPSRLPPGLRSRCSRSSTPQGRSPSPSPCP